MNYSILYKLEVDFLMLLYISILVNFERKTVKVETYNDLKEPHFIEMCWLNEMPVSR
jgi:hypothetical protein